MKFPVHPLPGAQVVAHVAEAYHAELQFVVKESGMFSDTIRACTPAEFEARLAALAGQLEGFRRRERVLCQ